MSDTVVKLIDQIVDHERQVKGQVQVGLEVFQRFVYDFYMIFGKPLWLSGKVVIRRKSRGPHPGQPLFKRFFPDS
jgi:hypothetical protein